jgi:hypothetical protein
VSRHLRGQATLALLLAGLAALIVLGFLLAVVVGLEIIPPELRDGPTATVSLLSRL